LAHARHLFGQRTLLLDDMSTPQKKSSVSGIALAVESPVRNEGQVGSGYLHSAAASFGQVLRVLNFLKRNVPVVMKAAARPSTTLCRCSTYAYTLVCEEQA
jgi:hypothetical protein